MLKTAVMFALAVMALCTFDAPAQSLIFSDPIDPAQSAPVVGAGWTEIGELTSSTTVGATRFGPASIDRAAGWIDFTYARPSAPIPWATANARPAVTRTFPATATPFIDTLSFDFGVHANGRIVHDVGVAPVGGISATGDIRLGLKVTNGLTVRISQTDTATANATASVITVENGIERTIATAPFAGGFRSGNVYSATLRFGGELTLRSAGGAFVTRTFPRLQFSAPLGLAFIRDVEGGVSNGVAWSDPNSYSTKFGNVMLRTGGTTPTTTAFPVFEDRITSTTSTVVAGWTEINELSGSVTVGGTRLGPALLNRINGWLAFTYRRPTSAIPWNSANARPALTRTFASTAIATLHGISFDFIVHANGRVVHDVGIAPQGGTNTTNDIRLGLQVTNGILVRVSQTDSASANATISAIYVENGVERVLTSAPFPGGFRAGTIYTASTRFDGELKFGVVGGSSVTRTFTPPQASDPMSIAFIRDLEGGISNGVAWTDQNAYTTQFGNVVLTTKQAPVVPVAPPTTIAMLPFSSPPMVGDAPLVSWRITDPQGRINQVAGTVRLTMSDGFSQDCAAGNGACFIRTLQAGNVNIKLTLLDPTSTVLASTEGIVSVSKQPVKFWVIASQTMPSLPQQRSVAVIFGLARTKDVGGPTPTGPVTFISENGANCSANTPNSNECVFTIPNASGRVEISGYFPGDANYEAATIVHAHVLPDDTAPVTPARVYLNSPATATSGSPVSVAFTVENATTLTAPVRIWAFPGGLLCSAPASVGVCPTTFQTPGVTQIHAEFVDANPAKAANSQLRSITVTGAATTPATASIQAVEVPTAVVGRNFAPRVVATAPGGASIEMRLNTSTCTSSLVVGTCSLPIVAGGSQTLVVSIINGGGQVLTSRSISVNPSSTSSATLTVSAKMMTKNVNGVWVSAKCIRRNAMAETMWIGEACANGATLFEGGAAGVRVEVVNRGTAASSSTQLAVHTPRGRVNLPVQALQPGASWSAIHAFDIEKLAFRRKVLPATPQIVTTTAGSTPALIYLNHAWQSLPGADFDNLYTATAGLANQDAAVTEFSVLPRPIAFVHGWASGPNTWDHYPQFLAETYRPSVGEWIGLPARLKLGGAGKFFTGYFSEVPIGTCGDFSCASAGDVANNMFANAIELGRFIQEWREELGFGETLAIAHSAGGLVLRAHIDGDAPAIHQGRIVGASGRLPFAMTVEDGKPMIRKAITIGTPHLGWACNVLSLRKQRAVVGWDTSMTTPIWLEDAGEINLGALLSSSFVTGEFNPLVNQTHGVPFVKIGTAGGPLFTGMFADDVRDLRTVITAAKILIVVASARAPMTSLVPVAASNRGYATLFETTAQVVETVCPNGNDSDGLVDFNSSTFGDREFKSVQGHLRQTSSRELFRTLVMPQLQN